MSGYLDQIKNNNLQRSKERILWLYNETRRKRAGKLVALKEAVLENADTFRSKVIR
jgi:hypothetical protein